VFEPQQFVERQALGGQQKGCTTVPAIAGHNGAVVKLASKLTQLGCCRLHTGLLRTDALLIEHGCPTAGLLWQEHDRRKLPAIVRVAPAKWGL